MEIEMCLLCFTKKPNFYRCGNNVNNYIVQYKIAATLICPANHSCFESGLWKLTLLQRRTLRVDKKCIGDKVISD